jgi:hypothetical protein
LGGGTITDGEIVMGFLEAEVGAKGKFADNRGI